VLTGHADLLTELVVGIAEALLRVPRALGDRAVEPAGSISRCIRLFMAYVALNCVSRPFILPD